MDSDKRLDAGRYLVDRLLGEGAQGATYAATDTTNGRAVAIKRFDVRGARSWKDVELAEREIRVLASLDHTLVPRYITHFEEDGALFLVMERIDGETLEDIRKRKGACSEAEVLRFLACADRALGYLHGRGSPVVHRDIKPSNVVRTKSGDYVLVDFGAVTEVLFRRGSSTIVGTAGYMAPEQIQGRATPASDVYAVGATALAALTGKEPGDLPHKGLRIDVRAAVGDRASPELVAALERMLEPDPDHRAPSLAASLEPRTAAPAPAPTPAPAATRPADAPMTSEQIASEDAIVKSMRRLIWALWGLGWIIVPLIFGEVLQLPVGIPIVMFGWMAAILVLTWHRGAMLRAGVRWWRGEAAQAPVRARVDAEQPRARVQSSEVRVDAEPTTDVETADEPLRRQRRS
jgi:serine/threonine protein kinase